MMESIGWRDVVGVASEEFVVVGCSPFRVGVLFSYPVNKASLIDVL